MFRKLVLLGCLAVAAPAAAQPASDPSQLFGVRPSIEAIDISPDGSHVVYLQPGPGRTTRVYLADLNSDAEPQAVARSDGDPERLRWCNFVANDRLICQVSGMSVVTGLLTPFSRLMSIDTNGQNITLLGQRASYFDARLRQSDGSILDWLAPGDGAVLMAREIIPEETPGGTRMVRTAEGLAVARIDVRTLRSTPVEAANRRASAYISDGRGHVRIMASRDLRGNSGQLGTRTDYFYRTQSDRDWRALGSYDSATREGMIPIAVDPALDAAYVLKPLNGRRALYRIKLDGSMTTELVYSNERVDVDDVVTVNRGARVIGVTFAEETQRAIYFDADYANLAGSLARAIPNLPLIDFGGTSADGNRLLIHAGSDSDAGRYFVYDRAARSLNEILTVRPQIEGLPPASVRAVTYAAADGTQIPAYLTLPPGGSGRNLPAVILPHGGPTSRDVWGFDWLAQYLAHRGYAVLQPNYRGSAGYGDQWLQQNGYRGWRTSIGDIGAGARWLAAQGIADAGRIAIVGWSYGGYAALQSGATEPGLYKAIVAIAPVTDLQQAKDDLLGYDIGRNAAEYIGSGPHVVEGSPLQNVRSIAAPVLLIHGDRDLNVNVIHSRRMDAALRGAGKSSELIVLPGLEHDLDDSAARTRMLQRIGEFLAAALHS
jgi:dienelactone hydrolase